MSTCRIVRIILPKVTRTRALHRFSFFTTRSRRPPRVAFLLRFLCVLLLKNKALKPEFFAVAAIGAQTVRLDETSLGGRKICFAPATRSDLEVERMVSGRSLDGR
jgi:hypothetical protein